MDLSRLKLRIKHHASDHNVPEKRVKIMIHALEHIFEKFDPDVPDDLTTVFEPFVSKEPLTEDDLMNMAYTMVEAWILLIEYEQFDPG